MAQQLRINLKVAIKKGAESCDIRHKNQWLTNKKRKHSFLDEHNQIVYLHGSDYIPKGYKAVLDDAMYYPSHRAVDFYHHYKEDIALFAEWGLKYSVFLSHEQESFLPEKKKHQMKKVYSFMTMSLMNV